MDVSAGAGFSEVAKCFGRRPSKKQKLRSHQKDENLKIMTKTHKPQISECGEVSAGDAKRGNLQ